MLSPRTPKLTYNSFPLQSAQRPLVNVKLLPLKLLEVLPPGLQSLQQQMLLPSRTLQPFREVSSNLNERSKSTKP